jgi:diadenosine tetraphosphate (Ap4A) HIT family hydrolase
MADPLSCPFCSLTPDRIWLESAGGRAVSDLHPVSRGHTLVIPRRHVRSVYELGEEEIADLWGMAGRVRKELAEKLSPDGFNIGLNDGAAAGQTVPHAHIHVVPRFSGDVPDPRGGVRWVIPERAVYWDRIS